jgi:cell pole-organizing protein PopZ
MEEILASIRRILAEDEGVAPVIARAPANAPAYVDVLDLTEAIADDGTIRHIPVFAEVAAPAPPLPDGRIEPAPPRPDNANGEPLVSAATSGATAAAFARLASVLRDPHRTGEAGLDEAVRDMLRPLLQTWLDENLPGLVERLVRAEIARVVGDSPRR